MNVVSRRRLRQVRSALYALLLILVLDFLWSTQSSYPLPISVPNAQALNNISSVYIASTQWNSASLLQEHWIPNLLQVARDLKAANISIVISIYENGSTDDTKDLLVGLKRALDEDQIQNEITVDGTTHDQTIAHHTSPSGWLQTAYGREMRRIPYLATVRNEALNPLSTLAASGVMFDKLLYVKDVVFTVGSPLSSVWISSTEDHSCGQPSDIWTLLNTRNGKYAAACVLDFVNPPWNWVTDQRSLANPSGIYDDFATRDSNGNVLGSHLHPYFSSWPSKKAVISGDVVPVQGCWNGLVASDAAPFQRLQNPLRFRGISDSLAQYHVEASECCTIHYDNPLSPKLGVWINPAVRVAYSSAAYNAVVASPGKRHNSQWPTAFELRWGYWSSKWIWWLRDPASPAKTWHLIRQWHQDHAHTVEPALPCVSDLAMVLTSKGWALRGVQFE